MAFRSADRSRRVACLAVLAAAGVAGCGGERSSAAAGQRSLSSFSPPRVAPGHENQVLAERQWLDRIGVQAVGDAYACASVSPRRRPWKPSTMRMLVFVTGADAKPRARRLARKLSVPAGIRLVSPRMRMSEMRRIRREAERTRPAAAAAAVEQVAFIEIDRGCPPIEVSYVKGQPGAAEAERWVTDLQARHGPDRVRVRRLDPPRPRVARWSLARRPNGDDTALSLLVSERSCSSGRSAERRIGTSVSYGAEVIRVTVRVRPLAGAQTCQGVSPTPFTLVLADAVGDRRVADGAGRSASG